MATESGKYTIKDYPKALRPRERMEQVGADGLSDRELIAILLSTGTKEQNALEIADILLTEHKGLNGLAQLSIEELGQTKGIGLGKGSRIAAALEIGKRVSVQGNEYRPHVGSPHDAANLLMENMRYLDREVFKIMLLNTKNRVLSIETISVGSLNTSLVHPREVFKVAIKKSAHAIILGHNHPSGDPNPSLEDQQITKRLTEVGVLIGIAVLDHLIIGDNKYISFKAEGLL